MAGAGHTTWPEGAGMHGGGAAAALPFYPGAVAHNGYAPHPAHAAFVAPPVLGQDIVPTGAALTAAILYQVCVSLLVHATPIPSLLGARLYQACASLIHPLATHMHRAVETLTLTVIYR